MPLKVNVPTGRKDWKLTKCPECGAQCWELPLAEVAKAQGAKGLCTMCALKKGVSGWHCDNFTADAYGCDTEYDDGEECPDFESKR